MVPALTVSSLRPVAWVCLSVRYVRVTTDYGAFIKNDPNADDFEGPPRPKTPMRGHAAFYSNSAFDQQRVQYVRYETQYLLIRCAAEDAGRSRSAAC